MTRETQIQQTQSGAILPSPVISNSMDSDFDKLLAKEKSLELSSFDQEVYDQLFRLANVMADTGVVPDSLRTEGAKNNKKELPRERVVANCFLVAEQAHRWECSPFKLLGEAAIVYGKLGWEGKTINALIQKFAGVYLKFEYNNKSGDDLGVTVSGTLPGEDEPRIVPGTVKSWKTVGDGSPWKMSDDIALKRQLSYRGAREWMRIHLPSIMFGVLAIDEIRDFSKKESAIVFNDEPINPFKEQPKEIADKKAKKPTSKRPIARSSKNDSKRSQMIEEIKGLANSLDKTMDDWNVLFKHYGAESLESMKDIELRSILAKLKKEKPEDLALEGSIV